MLFNCLFLQRSRRVSRFILFLAVHVPFILCAQTKTPVQRADSLLRLMTIEEKIGQLNQYSDDNKVTGPVRPDNTKIDQVRNGQVGSLLNVIGAERTRSWQQIAMQSRLRIPLLFAQDVIHGFKTTFPIPLAEACSWDMEAIRMAARVAATEASASGIHWTFAPMVDITRDPRWGRVMEGAGEDSYLGSGIAAARVKGFQGAKLGDVDAVMACVKHFAAYGAAEGGREYNSVDISERRLWEIYLPPFKAAVDAGAATFMNAFNDINGVPCTGNKYLLRDILKGKWGYKGFVVSDWGSIAEMMEHGTAKNEKEAARAALLAGSDMDMESRCYKNHLAALVKEKQVPLTLVDDAVRRILQKKFELGLFEDPYKFCNLQREQEAFSNPAHTAVAREVAAKSIVLLKNEGQILPLSRSVKTIAFIGPLVKELKQNKGFWDVDIPGLDSNFIVSQWEGLENKLGNSARLLYAKGCTIDGIDKSGFAEAIQAARQADVVIVSIGERRDQSGEAKSRSDIRIPGVQEELVMELLATGKPVVVLINAGRPLVFPALAEKAPVILYTWWLGSEAGNAIADVLFGDYNPSAKLAITFPRQVGQVPIYYNHLNTGRPPASDNYEIHKSNYLDVSIYPQFEFGYGLSYTRFTYSDLRLDKQRIQGREKMEVTLRITNSGPFDGEEIVQLYIRDKVSSLARPVKELKDFAKIRLKAGESKTLRFIIDRDKLSFYNQQLQWVAEPGEFELMIGASSSDIRLRDRFILEK